VLTPMLVFLSGYGQHRAQGTSLVALVPPTGLFAFLAYYHAGDVSIRTGLLLMPGALLGGWMGGKLAESLAPRRMRKIFAAALLLVGAWQVISGLSG